MAKVRSLTPADKRGLIYRLRREGRFEAARKFKDESYARLVAVGTKRGEAGQAAWKAMAEKYPALPEEELVHRRLVRECAPLELAPVSSSFKRPASWGVLPSTAELPDEVDWVYQNYELVVEETSRGHRVDLSRARCAPPSEGTMLLFRLALQNLNGFIRDVVQKVKKVGESAEDEEYVKKERKSIAEIERILDAMEDALR